MTLKLNTYILSIALLGLLTSCGGSTTTADNGGIGGTGMTVGTVSSYGSIFVNGIEFFTNNSTVITLDGVTVINERDIDIGMVVSVAGSVNADGLTGTANTVTFRDELEGPVSVNNVVVGGTITVLGQVVTINSQTVYEPGISGYLTLAAIPGDGSVVVEVSGYPNGLGNVYATRVEVKAVGWVDGDSAIEVKGIVEEYSAPAVPSTFMMGNLTVNYFGAVGAGLLADGAYVQVHSDLGFIDGQLVASTIELESEGDLSVDGSEGDEFGIEGTITTALSGDLFSLNGQSVRISAGTEMDAAALTSLSIVGSVVEVHGTLDAFYVIDAEEIEGRATASIHVAAVVENANAVNSTVDLIGLTITITPTTIITDETGSIDWPLQVATLDGKYLEVEVARDGSNLIAVRLEVENLPSDPLEVELEGLITSPTLSPLEVEGVSVNPNGLSLGGATGEGDELSVTGTWDGSTLTATTIE